MLLLRESANHRLKKEYYPYNKIIVLLNASSKFISKDRRVISFWSGVFYYVDPIKISKFTWFEKLLHRSVNDTKKPVLV